MGSGGGGAPTVMLIPIWDVAEVPKPTGRARPSPIAKPNRKEVRSVI